MFLAEVGSTDARFKTIKFHDGLNLLVAERTEDSRQGDSRNGTGKSSFIRILRYVLGGNLPDEFKSPELAGHSFSASLSSDRAAMASARVVRPTSPTTKLSVSGWNGSDNAASEHVDDWRRLLGKLAFSLPEDTSRPTPGQLWGQLIHTSFGNPVKSHPSESDWETGVKLGYLLGLDVDVLNGAGEVARLEKQRRAIKGVIKEGAIGHLNLDEADLRAKLAGLRRQRDRMRQSLQDFQVDEAYGAHQRIADSHSAEIREINDESLGLERRARDLARAIETDVASNNASLLSDKLEKTYAEINLVLPEMVSRRFEEVAAFHASVVRNRRTFLEDELRLALSRLVELAQRRTDLDRRRAEILVLLQDSVALDTFLDAQRSLAELEAGVAETERRLESAMAVGKIDTTVQTVTANTVASVRAEVQDRADSLERPISLFSELGQEIYKDRSARLLISTSPKGVFQVRPEIDGDASDGIKGVATFLLDMVCLIRALEIGRAPRILVHDSHLFDAVDHRQVASCLNIGARLADEHGFQYIVTMNSDFLKSVESEGAFSRDDYLVDTVITDATENGGIFGFKFV
ncbi:ABC-three component system protein [Cryobacterium cryoconiti]|uniref:DUF2326 domain-containing protein n=1 Tax=Cryobacterium cryoconiti TaxID=1259239 RepID=A0A4Y8JSV0_9MICO|nr:ABC-three component system protein [Cryobacterium cryoconiti]TFD28275.1 DUF2326 domain-containing protein [Cryobacterium cryoconiti]